jgi:PAS domain S-box-containing protein
LAESDVPLAYKKAQRLQGEMPADATLTDKARVLNLLARIETYAAQVDASAGHSQQALEIAKGSGDRIGQAEAYLNINLNSVNQANIDSLIDAARRAMEVLQGVDRPDLVGEAMLRVSMMYRRIGQMDESVTICMQAMDIAKLSNDPMAQLYAFQCLGISFEQSEHHADARVYFTQMRDLARAVQAKQLEADAIDGLASAAGNMGDWRTAVSLQREAIALYRSAGAPFSIAHGLYSLSIKYRHQGRLADSMKMLDETLHIYEQHSNKIGMWWALNARSENYQMMKRPDLARADAERGYALAQNLSLLLYRSESAKRMAAIYAAMGEHKRAYQFSAEATELTDKINREKTSARMVELAQRYQNESKQKKIDELSLREQQSSLERQWLQTVLFGTFILLAGGAYFLLRLRRSQHLLAATNEQLRQSQDEINVLNTGLEHRVQAQTAELRQQTRYLRTLIDTLPVSIWLKDTGGRYLAVNASTAAAGLPARIGYAPEQMIGKTDEELWPDDTMRSFSVRDIEVMQTRQHKTYEIEIPGEDGGVIWREVDKAPVIDEDGSVLGIVGFARDISERKRTEELLRFIAQGEWLNRGEIFLNALVRYLGQMLHVDYVIIDKISSDSTYAETVALYAKGDVVPNMRYLLQGTPCANVMDGSLCCYPANVQGQFPEDGLLVEMQAESYAGLPLWDTDGKVIGLIAVVDGKTMGDTNLLKSLLQLVATSVAAELKRSQMEQARVAREQQLRALAESSPGMMGAFYACPDGSFCMPYVSPNIEALFGLRPQDVAVDAAPLLALNHPDDAQRVKDTIAESARTMTVWHQEYRILHPAKGERWMESNTKPELHPDGGVVWYGYVHDITKRKRMETVLRASHNFLDSVIDSVSDPIFVKDRQHRWTMLNDAFCTFIGLSRENLLGKSDYDFFPAEQADEFWAKDELVFNAGESNLNEERFTSATGEEHYIQTKKTPFISGDGHPMLVGVIRDITDFKRYQEAREAALDEAMRLAKARSEFLAHMSHELRTPLNGILGYTQILQRDPTLSARNADALNVIRQSGEHLLSLVEDILDLARIEAGRFKLDVGDISLDTFLHVVVDIVSIRAKQKGVEFITDLAVDLPAGILGDDKRLRQVLLNLLSNAIKFTKHGKVVLHVSRTSASRIAFAIEDTGVGIAVSELETIFQPFEQAGDLMQRHGGAGLGLSISRQLVRMMGGDIAVESTLGKGSTFRFELELPAVEIDIAGLLPVSAGNKQAENTYVKKTANPLITPSNDEMKNLHRLAQMGNMRDIVQYSEYICAIDPRYQPFAERLRRMAEGFQSKAILAFVERYLHDTKS